MGKKSTEAQVALRVATVAEMLVKGQSRHDIIQYSEKKFDVGTSQADNYIAKAKDKIKHQADELVQIQAEIAIKRLNDLYKRSYNIQDYRECRQVQGDIISLLDLKSKLSIKKSDDKKQNPNMRPVKNF